MNEARADWHRSAVIYELAVHSYQDGNGDGFGDLAGLTKRLDYLEWLGVDALWLLPIMPSPMRDGGYDVSDLTAVRTEYGTISDVRAFVEDAHARGMRVLTDFVINHTSDQHPWFQESRQPGSDKRDWYVWSDTPDRYADARVIFVDTHDSNWTWDETAGAYYWHRFFDHQPDLNFENPDVRAAVKDAIRFWLGLGLDGLRLDAVPYLFEEEGTNCENLPETHAYLKEIRAMVDVEFPNAVLLSEANQWPEELLPYFGDDDECHMAFHFPLMPRLFLALAIADVTPIDDIIARTPAPPPNSRWALFLRNHDEVTLEMVTEEDRQTMYEAYAPDPSMRKNLGIRRRLAPMLRNDRRKIELLNAVILSLPGAPVIYYGDEIGMGDIHTLDDRDGVRTPMQWDGSPSGGWSTADPDDFYLPVVTGEKYGPAAVNVADQMEDPSSLLWFMRDILSTRRATPELFEADYARLDAGSNAVLAYARDAVHVFANFSGQPHSIGTSGSILAGTGTMVGTALELPPFGWAWIRVDEESP